PSISRVTRRGPIYAPATFVFFSSRRRHTRSKRDWSSDVCSSDLADALHEQVARVRESTRPSLPDADRESVRETAEWLRHRESVRPAAEQAALRELLEHLAPPPF